MKPVTQSRVGNSGTCFRAALASIFNLPESAVPDFFGTEDEYWSQVQDWLAERGLKYCRVPATEANRPKGWSTVEGISPRGGLHACVGYAGKIIHDPHPKELNDGQGLRQVKWYGLLEPITRATDTLTQLERLRAKTENQPFFMQVTEKDGRERTVPVSKMGATDAQVDEDAKVIAQVFKSSGKAAAVSKAKELTAGQPAWAVSALFDKALYILIPGNDREARLARNEAVRSGRIVDVAGFPSIDQFLTRHGWTLKDKKRRLWFNYSYGTYDEEKAIEIAYAHIEELREAGLLTKTKGTAFDRRARLHRALDKAMDANEPLPVSREALEREIRILEARMNSGRSNAGTAKRYWACKEALKATTKATDGDKTSLIALLLSFYALWKSRQEEPEVKNYDLTKYIPKKRTL